MLQLQGHFWFHIHKSLVHSLSTVVTYPLPLQQVPIRNIFFSLNLINVELMYGIFSFKNSFKKVMYTKNRNTGSRSSCTEFCEPKEG